MTIKDPVFHASIEQRLAVLSEENGRLLDRIAKLEAALAEAKRMTALTSRVAIDAMNSDEE